MTTAEVQVPAIVPCGGGTLVIDSSGQVTLLADGRPDAHGQLEDVRRGDYVALWCGSDWGCLIGEDGRELWCFWPEEGRLERVAELERLDFRGGIDPGGFRRVEFHELTNGDLLITYELGIARLTPEGRLTWQSTHDQTSARLQRLDTEAAWFQGEYEPFGFRLTDGHPVFSQRRGQDLDRQ
jgi:hypothetical protein